MLIVERFARADAFLAATRDLFAESELEHSLKLGIASVLAQHPSASPDAWFAVLRDGGAVRGCALQTPPRNLVISRMDPDVAEALALHLAHSDVRFPAVHGPVRAAFAFADAWVRRRSLVARTQLCLRLFRLDKVALRPTAQGYMRAARARDEALVVRWFQAFHREAIPSDPIDPTLVARRALETNRVFVWDDGGPVALAAVGRELPSSASIGPVYTPPERRCRGYATALVAAVSQHVLDNGKRYACLFTDLSNPVSNSIYPKIGYQPVSDFREIAFEAPPS